jgi:colicin import membrane protein
MTEGTKQSTSVTLFDAATAIASFKQTEADLTALAAKHETEVFDVSTTKGLNVAKEVRRTFKDIRLAIEKTRSEKKADALAFGKKLDDHAKKLQATIAAAEKNADDQIKAEEKRKADERDAELKAEQEQIARENALLDSIRDVPLLAVGDSADAISDVLENLRGASLDSLTGKAHERGVMLKAKSIAALETILAGARASEAETKRKTDQEAQERAEREAAAKSQADADRAAAAQRDADAAAKREADELARKNRQAAEDEERAEAQRKAEEQRKEDDRLAAERRKALDDEAAKQRAERERLDEEARKLAVAKAEQEKKDSEAREAARLEWLKANAPPLREAAINALSLMTSKGLGASDEAIQLKHAIEKDSQS